MCMALKMQDVYFHFRQPYIASLYAYTIPQQVVGGLLLILLLFTPNLITLCDNPPSSLNQKLSLSVRSVTSVHVATLNFSE